MEYFEALSKNLLGGTEETHGKQLSGQESKRGEPECKARMPTTEQRR